MRNAVFAILFGSSALVSATALAQTTTGAGSGAATPQAQSGPADLCQELLAYAEKKAAEPPKEAQAQAPTPAAAPLPRTEGKGTGTQGGGSVDQSASRDTSSQGSAPPTTPATPGAASEPATSSHASEGSGQTSGATPPGAPVPKEEFKLAGGVPLQQVQDTVKGGDRQACRDATQKLRRAGADLPAGLIALAAYEPDPAKRK